MRPRYPVSSHLISSSASARQGLEFDLPSELEAGLPPEARGLARDEVRLMVSYRSDNRVIHTKFKQIGDFLTAGDLLVINTSGTMNAALNATRADGTPLELHLSTHLPADLWAVEVRAQSGKTTRPFRESRAGETLRLEAGAEVTLHAPYLNNRNSDSLPAWHRLWVATLRLPCSLQEYLKQYGFPIRYSYVQEQWPLDYYQTVYATEPGSAEMPSAGRAFTPTLITQLVAHGIQIAPLILHTGVASIEDHEPPYEEYYRVPPETARMVNAARATGRRVIAVGTTVVRALETVTEIDGTTHPGEGWTNIVVTPERGIHAIDALLTGLHEPHASHLFMLEALASREHLKITYDEALRKGYLWHEFGDLHLILP
ncbi:MAG TPA: S-adenosylmethionine:tRNA ribosyltransferase-isomerase [Ktedonobacteraceae bacterium]|nr:S-adenosylmethionine:tRNA ribosyltransferase-isomerase [Ktedonobacteraceae bacterium]